MSLPELNFTPSLSLSPATVAPGAHSVLQANAVVDRQRVEIGAADQVVLVIGTVSFYNTGDTALDDVLLVVPRVEGIRPVNRADIEEATRLIYRVGRLEPRVIRTTRVQWWVQRPARYSVPLVVQARGITDILLPAVTFEGVAAASTPSPTAAPRTGTPRPTVAGSPAPKGALLWQASLDASGSAIKATTIEPSGAAHKVRPLAGAIEIEIQGTGFVVITLDQPQPASFYLEIDAQVGNQLLLVDVATDQACRYALAVNGTTSSVYVWRERSGTVFCENALLTDSMQSPDLAVRRRVTAGISVSSSSYDLYLGGRLVGRASVSGPSRTTAIALRTRGTPGVFRIEGVRLYTLGP